MATIRIEKNFYVTAKNVDKYAAAFSEKMKLKKVEYRPILKFTLSGEFIEEFDSPYNAAKSINDKAKPSNIKICCSGERKKAYKFIWKFKQ